MFTLKTSGNPLAKATKFSLRKHGPSYKLSDNFTLIEMACKDGSDLVLVHPALVYVLQRVRAEFGVTHINSGYRTPSHNAAIGGSSNSRHKYGLAADIVVRGTTPNEIATFCEKLKIGGVGRYNTFTHIDVQGNNRRWDNR